MFSSSFRSVFALGLVVSLSGCGAVSALNNAMPTGYAHNHTKPISEPSRISKPYDKDITFAPQKVHERFVMHKEKTDELLEQMEPTLKTVLPSDKFFLVSEQKNRDFDDALRLSLRNMGLSLDLTSAARYQLVYTIRKAKSEDFEGMSVVPEQKDISSYEFYSLNLIDTKQGGVIADAWLIPGYHGFKTNLGYEEILPEKEEAVVEAAEPEVVPDVNAVMAKPVMDDSPMLAPPEQADQAPMPITGEEQSSL